MLRHSYKLIQNTEIKIELPDTSTTLNTLYNSGSNTKYVIIISMVCLGFSSQTTLCIFSIVHLLHVPMPWRLVKSLECLQQEYRV